MGFASRFATRCMADLNRLVVHEPALHQQDFDHHGFEWIDCQNGNDSILSYIRKGKNPDDFVVVCCNFTPVPRPNYRLGVPKVGHYHEIFNSDSSFYAGSNMGNGNGLLATNQGSHGRPASLEVTIPPLGLVVLKPQ